LSLWEIILAFHFINHLNLGWFMVFKTTFNNISVISWRSVLLVEETGAPRENHRPVAGNIVESGFKHHKPNHIC
jgi:hypothetical protein